MVDLYDFIHGSGESKSVVELTASLSSFLGAFGIGLTLRLPHGDT
jgi:hypothetical protein